MRHPAIILSMAAPFAAQAAPCPADHPGLAVGEDSRLVDWDQAWPYGAASLRLFFRAMLFEDA